MHDVEGHNRRQYILFSTIIILVLLQVLLFNTVVDNY